MHPNNIHQGVGFYFIFLGYGDTIFPNLIDLYILLGDYLMILGGGLNATTLKCILINICSPVYASCNSSPNPSRV